MNSIIDIEYWSEVPENYTGHAKHVNNTQAWYKNGKLHRENGPAVIGPSGAQDWCLDGQYYDKDVYYKELHQRGIITEQELFIELL